jgi:hypothetical protein
MACTLSAAFIDNNVYAPAPMPSWVIGPIGLPTPPPVLVVPAGLQTVVPTGIITNGLMRG